ncbi:hypothetical protein HRbin32_00450 [bacterium HR32]|nr:hypothetical protein HRbin32_00450 [bacterium HR32]
MWLLACLLSAAVLAGCGGGGGAVSGGISGRVFEGAGTDGGWSGRPVAGARVTYQGPGGTVTVTTDASGSFSLAVSPTGAFDLHVVPPTGDVAAFSAYGLPAQVSARPLAIYLSLRRPAGGPPPRSGGGSAASAVTGRLLDASGNPQPGAPPDFGSVGDPGTVGFVWWGFYRAQSPGCPRCYSTLSGPDGGFDVQGIMGGERAGRTHPFFAGNYDGISDGGRVLHYTQFAYRPAVDVLRSGPTPLGDVVMRPVAASLPLLYDPSALALVNGYGAGGLSYAFVQMYTSIASQPLELAEVAAGPAVGGGLSGQPAPVPEIPESQSTYFFATAFAFDLSAPVTAEFALTTAFRVSGQPLRVGYLTPPRSLQTGSGSRRTLSWVTPAGATLQYAAITDTALVPWWEAVLPGGTGSAAVPVDLQPGPYYAFVYATDALRPEEVVSGAVRLPRRSLGWRKPGERRPLRRGPWTNLDRTPFAGNMVREAYSDLVSFSVP